MQTFNELVADFSRRFSVASFPAEPSSLYDPIRYFLSLGGKRVRPVLCLMANELFGDLSEDAYEAAIAIELFHNFTLVHDDIMDAATLRRGMETVHKKYGSNTALLSGDVMLIACYEHLNRIQAKHIHRILSLFNRTTTEVCEGQQLDIDFEKEETVSPEEYINMIALKTSVLLAASLEMGAILGGASEGNCRQLYAFGKNLGIAFQVQDDYLDAFGDASIVGKEIGGDIRQNKKTFLLIRALEVLPAPGRNALQELMRSDDPGKVAKVLQIFRECGADQWARELKDRYLQAALRNLEDIAVLSVRKKPLTELASFLVQRDY